MPVIVAPFNFAVRCLHKDVEQYIISQGADMHVVYIEATFPYLYCRQS